MESSKVLLKHFLENIVIATKMISVRSNALDEYFWRLARV